MSDLKTLKLDIIQHVATSQDVALLTTIHHLLRLDEWSPPPSPSAHTATAPASSPAGVAELQASISAVFGASSSDDE